MQINTDFNIYLAQELFPIRKIETFERGIYVTMKISNIFNCLRSQNFCPIYLMNITKVIILQTREQLKQLQLSTIINKTQFNRYNGATITETFNIQPRKPI